jgi:hypothetical protein
MSDELTLKLQEAQARAAAVKAAADSEVREAERAVAARNRQARIDAARARQWGFSVHKHVEGYADRYGLGGGDRATMPLAIFTEWAAVVSFMESLAVTVEPDMATAFEVAQYVNTLYRNGDSMKLQTHKGYVIYRAPLNQQRYEEPVLSKEQRIDALKRQTAVLRNMGGETAKVLSEMLLIELELAESIDKDADHD